MASAYPGALDSFTTKVNDVDDVLANDVNELQDGLEAVQAELGTDPAGTYATVKERLDDGNMATVHASTSKATPVDADELPLSDSAASNALKKLTWSNLKATLYAALGALIAAGTSKATPVDADGLVLQDSASSNATKTLTWANLKTVLASTFQSKPFINLGTGSKVTISGGAITVTESFHIVDTEANAAADDLDTINGGNVGDILVLQTVVHTRDVTFKDGTGNLQLAGDFIATAPQDKLTLIRSSVSTWSELSRSKNA
ncbi:MAG TPA: hypothetical protein PKC99_06200 [Anaerolineales bacterium]|nr:hypothetical protein [Anaerolineales bacterium]